MNIYLILDRLESLQTLLNKLYRRCMNNLSLLIWNELHGIYSNYQKTEEYEDDMKAILKFIWFCYKPNWFTSTILNLLLSEMGLFTLHNWCTHCTIQSHTLSLKVDFIFQSFLVITEIFNGREYQHISVSKPKWLKFETSLDLIRVKGTVGVV